MRILECRTTDETKPDRQPEDIADLVALGRIMRDQIARRRMVHRDYMREYRAKQRAGYMARLGQQ